MSKPPDDELFQDKMILLQVRVCISLRRLAYTLCAIFWQFVSGDNLYVSKPPNDELYLSRHSFEPIKGRMYVTSP